MTAEVTPRMRDGRLWVHEHDLARLAVVHVDVMEAGVDDLDDGTGPGWAVTCGLCGHVGPSTDERLVAGHGDGIGGTHEYWRLAWPYAERHVIRAHRDEFPEHRTMPWDLYSWWLVRFAAEREDMERRHRVEAARAGRVPRPGPAGLPGVEAAAVVTGDFRYSPTNGPATRLTTKADERDQSMAVRAWAARHGMEVGARGRLPAELVDAYNAGDVADARDWYAHRRVDAPRRPAMPQLDIAQFRGKSRAAIAATFTDGGVEPGEADRLAGLVIHTMRSRQQ